MHASVTWPYERERGRYVSVPLRYAVPTKSIIGALHVCRTMTKRARGCVTKSLYKRYDAVRLRYGAAKVALDGRYDGVR